MFLKGLPLASELLELRLLNFGPTSKYDELSDITLTNIMGPDDVNEYDQFNGHRDGVFSRKVFSKVLDALSAKAHARIYRDNCY